mmetsp:Transcript_24852/g.70743  ORF Transcript_24852/g.70743 Transcript_24852/m.70743 type:complete len:304 (-) Transcript_24852:118-1029(-)
MLCERSTPCVPWTSTCTRVASAAASAERSLTPCWSRRGCIRPRWRTTGLPRSSSASCRSTSGCRGTGRRTTTTWSSTITSRASAGPPKTTAGGHPPRAAAWASLAVAGTSATAPRCRGRRRCHTLLSLGARASGRRRSASGARHLRSSISSSADPSHTESSACHPLSSIRGRLRSRRRLLRGSGPRRRRARATGTAVPRSPSRQSLPLARTETATASSQAQRWADRLWACTALPGCHPEATAAAARATAPARCPRVAQASRGRVLRYHTRRHRPPAATRAPAVAQEAAAPTGTRAHCRTLATG